MVLAEVERASENVRQLLSEVLDAGAENLTISSEATALHQAYIKGGVLGERWADDAMHVALASIRRVEVLASWNFKHLVDPRRSRGFSGINLSLGWGIIDIRSPAEIVRALEAK